MLLLFLLLSNSSSICKLFLCSQPGSIGKSLVSSLGVSLPGVAVNKDRTLDRDPKFSGLKNKVLFCITVKLR